MLSLTPAGKRVNARRGGTVEAAVERSLRQLGTRDRAATERTLAVLASELGGAADLAATSARP